MLPQNDAEWPVCEVSGCDKKTRTQRPRGHRFCAFHYNRWVKSGKVSPGPSKPLVASSNKGRVCEIEGCDRSVRCVGLCARHYEQARTDKRTPCVDCQTPSIGQRCSSCRAALNDYDENEHRKCTRCKVEKPHTEFGWRTSSSTSRATKARSRCRSCDVEEARLHREKLGKEEINRRKRAQKERARARLAALTGEERERYLWRRMEMSVRRSAITLGLDPMVVLDAFRENGNVCEVCDWTPDADSEARFKRVAVDHDHETGEFRGFLCGPCNTSLGHMERAVAHGLIHYLNRRVLT